MKQELVFMTVLSDQMLLLSAFCTGWPWFKYWTRE